MGGGLARVLLIEDDPMNYQMVREVLAKLGVPLEFECVHDGDHGLLKIGAWKPDILLLALLMPGVDGYVNKLIGVAKFTASVATFLQEGRRGK